MSIQKLFRSFKTSFSTTRREEFSLEEEVALYRRRAEVAFREERYQDGLVFLAKVLRLNPYDLSARMAVAEAYHRHLGEPTKALLTYEKVVAAAGYDDSNPLCVAARDAIRELTTVFEAPAIPAAELLDGENPFETADDLPREAVS